MKQNTKKQACLLCLLLAMMMLLTSCFHFENFSPSGEEVNTDESNTNKPNKPDTPPANGDMMSYTVSATDYFGNPMSGVVASIKKDGTEIKSIALGADGTETLSLEKGDYTVTLLKDTEQPSTMYFDYSFEYDSEACTLSVDQPNLSVVLTQKPSGREKLTFFDDNVYAYNVTGGAYRVTLSSGINYFIFRPDSAGTYEISIGSETASIGNYGAPTWIYETPTDTSVDGVLSLDISRLYVGADEKSTTPMVIGVDADVSDDTDFVLTFEKVEDLPLTPTEAPWNIYCNPNAELPKFNLPENVQLTNVDIFDPDLQIVFNETDGYYHVGSENGPVVLIRLTTESPYLASFFTICNTTQLGSYFYDEDGNFLYKESYNELIFQYTGLPNENGALETGAGIQDPITGTYPLDSYLAHFMQMAGEDMGWWNPNSIHYRFADTDMEGKVLTENAWLFACCYVAE